MGWAVLGFVIRNVTGQDAGEYIKKTIWEPSGSKYFSKNKFQKGHVAFSRYLKTRGCLEFED